MYEFEPPAALAAQRPLPPLLVTNSGETVERAADWPARRAEIEAAWRAYLGQSPFPDLEHRVVEEEEEDLGECTGARVWLQTEPGYLEACYRLVPKVRAAARLPAVIVFYYDVETPAGLAPAEREDVRAFARHLAERGYVTLAQRWFHEGYLDRPRGGGQSLAQRYEASVARFQRLAPGWKGLGRVAWDASRCVDYLSSLPYVDPERIGCMGHSLGGKMALYAAAFDPRLKATIASDLGIGLSFSNWEQPWYLGPEVQEPGFSLDHHQLLALIAPRPFLLIAGESADGERSWPYLASAQKVYRLYGRESDIGMVNHRSGHAPTPEALEAAYAWLAQRL